MHWVFCQAGERCWKQAAPSPIAWQQAVKIAQALEKSGSTDTADSEHWPESQGLVWAAEGCNVEHLKPFPAFAFWISLLSKEQLFLLESGPEVSNSPAYRDLSRFGPEALLLYARLACNLLKAI